MQMWHATICIKNSLQNGASLDVQTCPVSSVHTCPAWSFFLEIQFFFNISISCFFEYRNNKVNLLEHLTWKFEKKWCTPWCSYSKTPSRKIFYSEYQKLHNWYLLTYQLKNSAMNDVEHSFRMTSNLCCQPKSWKKSLLAENGCVHTCPLSILAPPSSRPT